MALPLLRSTPIRSLRCAAAAARAPTPTIRAVHGKHTPTIPSPTPFVPDVTTFLTLIGRGLSKHSSKIPDWEALFSLTSPQLRDLGVEPARSRRYLLRWRDNFIKGKMGVGGYLTHVSPEGVAEVRLVEVSAPGKPGTATSSPDTRKIVVNAPIDVAADALDVAALPEVKDVQIRRGHVISGPNFVPVKGSNATVARIQVREGLWEDKRGRKIDGGERRRAEVRAKMRGTAKGGR